MKAVKEPSESRRKDTSLPTEAAVRPECVLAFAQVHKEMETGAA